MKICVQLFVHNKYAICCMDETVAPLFINPNFLWSYSSAARGSSNQTQHYMSLVWSADLCLAIRHNPTFWIKLNTLIITCIPDIASSWAFSNLKKAKYSTYLLTRWTGGKWWCYRWSCCRCRRCISCSGWWWCKITCEKNSDKQHLKFSDSDVPLFW